MAFDEDFADPSDIEIPPDGGARKCHVVDARNAATIYAYKVWVATAIVLGVP